MSSLFSTLNLDSVFSSQSLEHLNSNLGHNNLIYLRFPHEVNHHLNRKPSYKSPLSLSALTFHASCATIIGPKHLPTIQTMHINIPTVLITLGAFTTSVMADVATIQSYCFFTTCSDTGRWGFNDGSTMDFNTPDNGCANTGIPHMVEYCVDDRRQRLHFRFDGQGKRCMVVTNVSPGDCGDGDFTTCSVKSYDEVQCSW